MQQAPVKAAASTPINRDWLPAALACLLCWGMWAFLAKVVSDAASPTQLQVLYTIGTLPVAGFVLFRIGIRKLSRDRLGIVFGMSNGVLTGLGALAFYAALGRGKASVISPLTGLFPIITIVLATLILRERMNAVQVAGGVVALAAIFLLSF